MKNYYAILKVESTATDEKIRKQYRKLAMRYHPDHNRDNAEAEELFKEITEAYNVLADNNQRQQYDVKLNATSRFTNKQAQGREHRSYKNRNSSYSTERNRKNSKHTNTVRQKLTNITQIFTKITDSVAVKVQNTVNNINKKKKHKINNQRWQTRCKRKGPSRRVKLRQSKHARYNIKNDNNAVKQRQREKKSLIYSMQQKRISKLLYSTLKYFSQTQLQIRKNSKRNTLQEGELDIVYYTPLTLNELQHGKTITIQIFNSGAYDGCYNETFKINIPKGSKSGQKLRIKGKGHIARNNTEEPTNANSRGDLYLHLEEI